MRNVTGWIWPSQASKKRESRAGLQSMLRPICFDVTHLVSRLGIRWPSGIDKVDLAYAQHFVHHGSGPFIHYGRSGPHVLSADRLRRIVQLSSEAHWQGRDLGRDDAFLRLRANLTGEDDRRCGHDYATRDPSWLEGKLFELRRFHMGAVSDRLDIPAGAIYLNVAQHFFEHERYFNWLNGRRDVRTVMLIHDLLPIDYPEFFQPSEAHCFPLRIGTALKHGKAFIVTSEAVRQRLSAELERRKLPLVPMLVAPLPSSLEGANLGQVVDPELAAVPYFVTVGTIEPRKNHLLLLAIWRQFGEAALQNGQPVPKLVVIGGRGWENEQVIDVLDRGVMTRPHVIEASGLSSAGLVCLLANARALLMPSFAEGYALPVVEALAVGTPVVATDAPVFREVTQGCALYRSAIDGVGWKRAIQMLANPGSELSRQAKASSQRFSKPVWSDYFGMVSRFIEAL
jgi:glycosyltransferase involved in cell wall biosynthesis